MMSKDAALAKGVWLPRWFLGLISGIMVPLVVTVILGIYYMRESQIRSEERVLAAQQLTQQSIQGMKDSLEYRLKSIEVQGKMNDEHTRQMESRLARVEGRKNVNQPPDLAQ